MYDTLKVRQKSKVEGVFMTKYDENLKYKVIDA